MNILYLLFSFTTGGTERLVSDICNEMAGRDHNVHLYVVNDHCSQEMLDALDPRIHIFLQKRAAGGGDKLKTMLRVAKYIRKHCIDTVHCNSFNAPDMLLLRPLLFPKVKILHTIHGMGQFPTLSKPKLFLRKLICDRFVAISQCVRDDIVRAGGPEHKVAIVYNAIDLHRFSLPEAPRQGDGSFRIGNVARIVPEIKGQDILIEAIGLLHETRPSIHCYFAGEPDAAHMEAFAQLKERVNSLGISDHITFLGNVQDVPSLLATLDAFVLPSRDEGFGISLVEAMAMGLPCIASELDGPAEVLVSGKYGLLFPSGDAQALAQQLELLMDDYARYKAAAMQTVSYVTSRFDIVNMCDQLEALMK